MKTSDRLGRVGGRISELDGIRGVAIWMVLLLHVFYGFRNPPGALYFLPNPLAIVIGHGWLGVDLFFILSGFLITGILLDTKRSPHYFRNFYVRRFFRIMPLYFTVVILWSLFYHGYGQFFLLSSAFGANLSPLFNVAVPHGPGVLWSLAIEEQFYLLWPVVVLLSSRRTILIISTFIFIGCPILRGIFAARGLNPETIYLLSWFRFDGLAGGALIAMWATSRYREKGASLLVAASLICTLALLSAGGSRFGIFGTKTPLAVAFRYTQAYLGFAALLILTIAYRNTKWTGLLRNHFLQWSGALSYCLYMVHLSLGDAYVYLIRRQNLIQVGATTSVLIRGAAIVVSSFGVAMLSRAYLEQVFLEWKDKFTVRETLEPVDTPLKLPCRTSA